MTPVFWELAEPWIPLPVDPPVERALPVDMYCAVCGRPGPCPRHEPKERDNTE